MTHPTTALTCPRCQGPMRERERETPDGKVVVMDVCPACGGLWLDKGELEKIVAAERSPGVSLDEEEEERRGDRHRGDGARGGHSGSDGHGQQQGRRRGGFFGNLFDSD